MLAQDLVGEGPTREQPETRSSNREDPAGSAR
jgi:hypothetical protein